MKTCGNQSCKKDISKLHPAKKYCNDQCRDEGYKTDKEFIEKRKEYQKNYKRNYYNQYLKSKRNA